MKKSEGGGDEVDMSFLKELEAQDDQQQSEQSNRAKK